MADNRPSKRKPNWTDTEQVVMLDLYAKYQDVLGSRETTVLSCHEKTKCWVHITHQLNQINPTVHRSVEEVKRKWHNLLGQGRRDFFDWKRARQDPKLPPVSMPVISRMALELHGGFRFEDWQGRTDTGLSDLTNQDNDAFIYLDAGNSEMSEDRAIDDQLDSTDAVASEVTNSAAQDNVKQECPSPVIIDVFCEDSTSLTPAVANATPPPHLNSTPTAAFQIQAGGLHPAFSNPTLQIQPTPVNLNAVAQPASPPTITSRNLVSTVTPLLSFAPHTTRLHHLPPPVSPGVNHPTIASSSPTPVTTTTIGHNIPSSAVNSSSFLEQPYLLGRVANPHPSEPSRKKLRGSESGLSERGAGLHAERGVGLHAEREAELRIDILQLEKDKLWLETEKLRLEIDILRKQKQQMSNNF